MVEERALATKHGYESPIWESLQETHDSYNGIAKDIISNLKTSNDVLFLASHNEQTVTMV